MVIVDVLSFSTSVSIAVTRGAAVLPYRGDDTSAAAAYAREQRAVLAVHRGQESADHPYSLSPASMLAARPGERIVLPSPNGATLTLLGAAAGPIVVAGCLRNAAAAAAHAAAAGGDVAVIAAGERWPDGSLRPALEDLLGAGAVLAHLDGGGLTAEAAVAAGAYRGAADPAALIHDSISGKELVGRGAAADVALAVEVDADQLVPVLDGNAYAAAVTARG